jgi:hypothetical protein
MTYITTAERIGRSMGLAEGRTEGLREGITMALTARFGTAGEALLPLVQQIAEPDTLHAVQSDTQQHDAG